MKKQYKTLEEILGNKIKISNFYENAFFICSELYEITQNSAGYNYDYALNKICFHIYKSFGTENFEDSFTESGFGNSDSSIEFVEVLYLPIVDRVETALLKIRKQKRKRK